MDRAKFLASMKSGAVKLTSFTPPGFAEPIYLKPMTMADIKAQLVRDDEAPDVRDRLRKDQYYIERSLARIMRNEKGELLFDESDDGQMAALKEVLDEGPHNTSRLIHEAQDKLQNPDKEEADPKGN